MMELARSIAADDLAVRAFKLYEGFGPEVPPGERGWGAKKVLDLRRIAEAGR